jgi:hypothetical protein
MSKMNTTLFCMITFALSSVWAAASGSGYDAKDFQCHPYSNKCYYKGHPVLVLPGVMNTHIKRVPGPGDKYVTNHIEYRRYDADKVLQEMHEAYVELEQAHPYFNWENPRWYCDTKIYDEYGVALRSLRDPPPCTAVMDSRGQLVDFKRMKHILDVCRRDVSYRVNTLKYIGHDVKFGGKPVKMETRRVADGSSPDVTEFFVDGTVLAPEEVIKLLDEIETAYPKDNYEKGYLQMKDRIKKEIQQRPY